MVKTTHFQVDNGDMTLIELESGRRILVDIKIRVATADDGDEDIPPVGDQLRERLKRDDKERFYVDAFLLTHPDKDHICGLREHFHLGDPSTWSKKDDKIIIREMWSSPIVFRRTSKNHKLCDDAVSWCDEARRRVAKFKAEGAQADGNRILIMGEDVDGKTDDLGAILIKTDEVFSKICGVVDFSFEARLLAPMKADNDDEEEVLTKNNSSVVMRIDLKLWSTTKARYLIGGDAEVAIWEKLWDRHKSRKSWLQYDVLIAPHHCSWHSLSWDSWSDLGEKAKVSPNARSALGQPLLGALIVSSSKPIKDDKDDPPCIRAKREYLDILTEVNGEFRCVCDGASDEPMEIEILSAGPKVKRLKVAATVAATTGLGSQPFAHG
ncbi:MAG: metallohydrolase [Xanthobacteraceae bacterium]|nr:MAG: metallohydrolase [Xanthobacteraceae bacterium]